MWDVFFDREGAEADTIALIEAVEQNRVDCALLDKHAARLEHELGIAVQCILIPFARNTAEQIEVLSLLAGQVTAGENLCCVCHSQLSASAHAGLGGCALFVARCQSQRVRAVLRRT